MKNTLLRLARYNQWANAKIIDLLRTQPSQFIEKEIASSFNSIRKTLLHMADGEYVWHCRLTGVQCLDLPSRTGKPIDALKETNQRMLDFVLSKDDHYFSQSTVYKNFKGEECADVNGSVVLHVFNHGSFHRGQVVGMMRNGGFTGPIESTDFIAFERV